MTLLRAVALAIGIAALWLAAWIFVPAPTYFLLTFGVGAPEISHWLILATIAGLALSVVGIRHSRFAQTAAGACGAALVLALTVWVRVPATIKRFEYAMRDVSASPAMPRRSRPIVLRDLFLPIALGEAK